MPSDDDKKKRNPPWSREELILALELYLREGLLDDGSPQVIELSETLKDLAFVQKEDPDVFRNANGVAMKLANFAAIDPAYAGKGLQGGGKLDKVIFHEYQDRRINLDHDASQIRAMWQGGYSERTVAETSKDELYEILNLKDLRERSYREIAIRRGQRTFRKSLLDAYQGLCAFTGCNAEPALEAAHILAFRGNYSDKVQNGLLLRADIHTLFDLGLLAVDPKQMSCLISADLRGTEYEELEGRRLILPRDGAKSPGKAHLEFHLSNSKCA
ncbi:MAG: HNH endonuclease [Candidatus Obscuribacterales bacterium]|nr:HNH endonuclease [Candidatus Obscuribacterales bacterium]